MANRVIQLELSTVGVDDVIGQLMIYQRDLEARCQELARQLANYGEMLAGIRFATAVYDTGNDVRVTTDFRNNRFVVRASGEAVAFIEFGAGITYAADHPLNGVFGTGAGTFSPKGHWDDPNGWIVPSSAGAYAGMQTYGNPPNMALYNTIEDLRRNVESIARGVFAR